MDVDDGSEQTVPKQTVTVSWSLQSLNIHAHPSLTLNFVEVDPPTTATKAIEGLVDAQLRTDGQRRSDDRLKTDRQEHSDDSDDSDEETSEKDPM